MSRKENLRKMMQIGNTAILAVSALASLFIVKNFAGDAPYRPLLFLRLLGSACMTGAGIFILILCKWAQDDDGGTDKMHPNRRFSLSGIYGNSKFEQPWEYRDYAQIRPIEKCVGHVFGQLGLDGSEAIDAFQNPQNPKLHDNQHIFAIGASGSGKTFSVGKTYCYQSIKMGHSVIHTDPKGELYRDMADVYRKHGYVVRRLNFNNPEKSDAWDCMRTLRADVPVYKTELEAATFADAIVSNIVDRTNPIYYDGPKLLLQALILRLVLDDTLQEEKNIKTIYKWLADPGGITFLNALFEKDTMPRKAWPCLGPYSLFIGSSANLAGNLKTNLGAGMQIIGTDIIADMLSIDEIDLELPGKKLCAYFIQFPVPKNAYRLPISLYFTMQFSALQALAVSNENQRLDVEVDFFLDEFAQCGILPQWDERISVIRSFGLNVFMILQTLDQFRKLYKDSADTIISNCATWLMLGVNDSVSAKYFSERIGQTSVEVSSESKEGFRKAIGMRNSPFDRTSVGTGKTALMSPDEIMKLEPNEIIILFQRRNPIWANAFPNTLHPYSKGARKVSDKDTPDLYDRERKKREYEEEEKYIEEYWKAHSIDPPPKNINDAPYIREPSVMTDMISIIRTDISGLLSGTKVRREIPAEYEDAAHPKLYMDIKSDSPIVAVLAHILGIRQKPKEDAEVSIRDRQQRNEDQRPLEYSCPPISGSGMPFAESAVFWDEETTEKSKNERNRKTEEEADAGASDEETKITKQPQAAEHSFTFVRNRPASEAAAAVSREQGSTSRRTAPSAAKRTRTD